MKNLAHAGFLIGVIVGLNGWADDLSPQKARELYYSEIIAGPKVSYVSTTAKPNGEVMTSYTWVRPDGAIWGRTEDSKRSFVAINNDDGHFEIFKGKVVLKDEMQVPRDKLAAESRNRPNGGMWRRLPSGELQEVKVVKKDENTFLVDGVERNISTMTPELADVLRSAAEPPPPRPLQLPLECFAMSETTYKGIPCYQITVSLDLTDGMVEFERRAASAELRPSVSTKSLKDGIVVKRQYTIDKEHGWTYAHSSYNRNGKLLSQSQVDKIEAASGFDEDLFKVPEELPVKVARPGVDTFDFVQSAFETPVPASTSRYWPWSSWRTAVVEGFFQYGSWVCGIVGVGILIFVFSYKQWEKRAAQTAWARAYPSRRRPRK